MSGVSGVSASAWALFEGSGWSSRHPHQRPAGGQDRGVLPARLAGLHGGDGHPASGRAGISRRRISTSTPPTAVLVNETFVQRFFPGERAVGRDFGRTEERDRLQPQHIVGVVGDAKYRELREPAPPTVYVPLESSVHSAANDAANPIVVAGWRA